MRVSLLVVFLGLTACDNTLEQPEAQHRPDPATVHPSLHFLDVTETSGVDMTLTSGRFPITQILEVKGGGLGLIDFDNDGDLDLFAPNGATLDSPHEGPGSRLFENLGDMIFRDVTSESGITFRRWGMGVAVGDIDADGFDDLFICAYGQNALWRNRGDGTFEDVTEASGIRGDAWSTGCAFGDVDADGDLDLYVVNYVQFDPDNPPSGGQFKSAMVFGGPRGMGADHDVLYENQGDGTFRDVSERAGCRPEVARFGLGAVILDVDLDGDQDIFVGNDSDPNFLFVNEGDGRFVERGFYSGLAASMDGINQATMGISVADVDGNGLPDIFSTNFSSDTNTLHLNLDGEIFDDRTQQFGLGMVSRPYLGWACAFGDFDHDADEDLMIVNGHVYSEATLETMDSAFRQPMLLFERDGARFEPVQSRRGGSCLLEPHVDRAMVAGDLDDDGDIDLAVGELNGPLRVIENIGDNKGNWLIVDLRERAGVGNRHAVGSKIVLAGAGGEQRRWIVGGGSFQSASSQRAHFGLAADEGPVTLTITWPDGTAQTTEDVDVNQHVVVQRR